MSFCTMCGSKLDDNAIVCSTCGSVVEGRNSDAGYDYAEPQFNGVEPQFDYAEPQQDYAEPQFDYAEPQTDYAAPQPIVPQTEKTIGLVSLILGGVAFLINPLYGLSIAAIITGAVGIATAGGRPKTKATIGLILGIVSILFQCVLDMLVTILTMGIGGVSVFF